MTAVASREPAAPTARPRLAWRPSGFFWLGGASYLLVTFGVFVYSLARTDGHLVYALDDAAIHLSVASNLADHGTWGVVPGHFESASSSPLWTVLLAGWLLVVPGPDSLAPLALNVAASLGVIALFGSVQTTLRPSIRRPLDVLATVALVTVLLFLPGLTFTGMEHTVQVLLVTGAVVLFHRRASGVPVPGPTWLPYALLALATLARFETGFLAVGIAVAMIVTSEGPTWRPSTRAGWRDPVAAVAVPVGTFAMFALVNRAMGQGFLPNSVLAKGSRPSDGVVILTDAFRTLGRDPLLAVLCAVALTALAVLGRRSAWAFPAVVVVVTLPLHLVFAKVGFYERYQAYLIAIGLYLVLGLLTELPPARVLAAPVLVCALVLFSGHKPRLTMRAEVAIADTYEQRYQVARFLAEHYDGEPVGTGELGYISLLHRGPLTDVFGLGDHEVLQEKQRVGGTPSPEYWTDLVDRRNIDVVAIYPGTLHATVPPTWFPVGTIGFDRPVTSAFDTELVIYATRADAVARLQRALEEFSEDVPSRTVVEVNDLAAMRADIELAEAAG